MAVRNAFGDLNVEVTQQSVLSILNNIEILLADIAQNQGFRDQSVGAQRVAVTAGTVTSVSNFGGVSAIMDQYSQFANTAGVLRQSIVVS